MRLRRLLLMNLFITLFLVVFMSFLVVFSQVVLRSKLEQGHLTDLIVQDSFSLAELASDYYRFNHDRARLQWQWTFDSLGEHIEDLEKLTETTLSTHYERMPRLIEMLDTGNELRREQAYTLLSVQEKQLVEESLRIQTELNEEVIVAQNRQAIVLFVSLVVLLLLSSWNIYTVLNRVFVPIGVFTKAVKEVGKGNLETRMIGKSRDEFGTLTDAFNEMVANIQENRREFQRLEQAKIHFISMTSHEMKSPLTVMKAQTQMLLRGLHGKLSDKQSSSLEKVEKHVNRLQAFINDLLDLSKIEASRMKFNFKEFKVKDLVENVVSDMEKYMPEKKIKIKTKISDTTIKTDPMRLEQILRNLITNAIKFSENKSKILVQVKEKKRRIVFSVKDKGVGISEPEKIFNPFYQEDNTLQRKYEGTGLGLAITRGLVEALRGDIWFETQKGKGTTFYVSLPKKVSKAKKVSLF